MAALVNANSVMPYTGSYNSARCPAAPSAPSPSVTPSALGRSSRASAPLRVALIKTATGPRGGAAAGRTSAPAAHAVLLVAEHAPQAPFGWHAPPAAVMQATGVVDDENFLLNHEQTLSFHSCSE